MRNRMPTNANPVYNQKAPVEIKDKSCNEYSIIIFSVVLILVPIPNPLRGITENSNVAKKIICIIY